MGTGDIPDGQGASEETLVSGTVVPDDPNALDSVRPYPRPFGPALHHDGAVVPSERIRLDRACLCG